AQPEQELIKARADKLKGLKVVDKIELPVDKRKEAPVASSDIQKDKGKRPRKRIPSPNEQGQRGTGPGQRPQQPGQRTGGPPQRGKGPFAPKTQKEEPTEKEIQDQIRATLAKLSGGSQKKGSGAKYRREKRQAFSEAQEQQMLHDQEASKT